MAINFRVQGDDTLVPNANALVDLDFANEYHANRGNGDWTALSDDDKMAAIIRGTDYLSAEFNFVGWKRWGEEQGQVVAWPRDGVTDENWRQITKIPLGVKRSVCELAFFSTKQNLYGHTDGTVSSNQKVEKHSIKIGPLEESTTFQSGGSIHTSPVYPHILNWLRPYTHGGLGSGRVIR